MGSYIASEWEVVDDDGFIFKRRKKTELSPGEVEKAEELKRSAEAQKQFRDARRKKNMAMLEAQKLKYTAEIEDWQRLLNTYEFDIRSKGQAVSELPESSEPVSKDEVDESINILELQVQVEAYEELIERLKNLRDHGQHMSNMLEKTIVSEKSRQFKGLVDEVTLLQNSPRFLINGLTSSQPAPLRIKALAVSTEVGRLLAQSPT